MNKKNIFANIWKFSATKSVAFMLIIPTVGSLVALIAFYFFLTQTKDDVIFTAVAGRQRMLSEQFGNYVHMVYDMGKEEDRKHLRELVATFDQSLAVIGQGGEIMDRRLSPPPPEIRDKIDIGKRLWIDLKSALLLVADQPTTTPQVVKANDFIRANIPRMRDISNEIVFDFELLSHNRKERTLWIFITVFSLNFVLLVTGIVVTKRYLTERNQAEEWLRSSQQNYEALVNSIEGIVWEADARNFQFSFVSRQAERLLGYPMERWLAEPNFWMDHIHPDDRNWVIAYCKNAIEKKEGHEFEYRMLTMDERTIWLRDIVTVVVENDEPVKLRGIMMDITVRKKAEEEVKKLSEVVHQSPDMVFITDPDGIIEYVNPAFEMSTGYSKEEAIGQTPRILKSGKMSAEYYKNVWSTIQSGKFIHTEVINRKKDGNIFIHNQTITPLKDSDGNTINFISTGKDITDQVETRKELERALEQAEQANRVKSLFLANMSHEIRTPLNAILGFSGLLETCTSHLIGEEERGFFDTIKDSGNRLMETVHEILDISLIEAGTYDLKMEYLELVTLVKDLVSGIKPMADKKGLKIEYSPEIDCAFIKADKYGVTQTISNIIDNAIKYTEQGEITVLLKKLSKEYVLTIQDTGIGIAEEYLDNLFETFSQESEGYTKKYQGIGLGMAIAKRHLDMNQAGIEVKSTKGVGTIVTLTFKQTKKPFPEKKVEKKEVEVAPSSESVEKPLVLLVEDDPGSQKLTEFYLKKKYDMCFAVSVDGAKQQLKKCPVDLILLDLSLVGNEDGLDLVRWMRKSKTWKNIPVIATTAHAFTTDQNNCLAAGCNDYLSKPIKKEKLLKKIRTYV